MTPADRARLLALASAAAEVNQATEERDCAVYYGRGKVPYGKEMLVATAHCQEWTKYIEATIPEKIIALLSALEAAEGVVEAAQLCSLPGTYEDSGVFIGRVRALIDAVAAHAAATTAKDGAG